LHLAGVEEGLAVQVHEPDFWIPETLLGGVFDADFVVAPERGELCALPAEGVREGLCRRLGALLGDDDS
jgi:hypothetical protein